WEPAPTATRSASPRSATTSPASRRWPARPRPSRRSPRRRRCRRCHSRICTPCPLSRNRMSLADPARRLAVDRVEAVGAYTLLVLRNDGGDVGRPGQFFMLSAWPEPPDAYLPRALSAAWADEREIAFLIDVRGAGTRALVDAASVEVRGPLGTGFAIADRPALLVGGGIGAAILPWLARELAQPPRALLGFRSEAHAVCAALVSDDPTVVLDPVLVTEPLGRLLPFDGV